MSRVKGSETVGGADGFEGDVDAGRARVPATFDEVVAAT